MVSGLMNRALAALLAVPAAAIVAAPAAAAPTLALDAPCYYTGSAVTASGTGFPAAAPIVVSDQDSNAFSVAATADPLGAFTASFPAPDLPQRPAIVPFTATALDGTDTTQTAAAQFFDVQPGVAANVNGALTTQVTWTIAGFVGGQTVYGHWVFNHRSRKTVEMGKVPDPCGIVHKKVARIPVPPKVGVWTAQFDAKKAWSATTKPRVFLRINVFRHSR
jgi:hypothetical protein